MKEVNIKKITTKALIVFMGAFPWNDEKIASYKLKYNWSLSFILKDKKIYIVLKNVIKVGNKCGSILVLWWLKL